MVVEGLLFVFEDELLFLRGGLEGSCVAFDRDAPIPEKDKRGPELRGVISASEVLVTLFELFCVGVNVPEVRTKDGLDPRLT
jgi:hypothetical protein